MDNFKTRKKRVVNDGKGVRLGEQVNTWGKTGDDGSGHAAKVVAQPSNQKEKRRVMERALNGLKDQKKQAEEEKRRNFDQAVFRLTAARNRKAVREGKPHEVDHESLNEISYNYEPSRESQRKTVQKRRARNWLDKQKGE